MVQAALVLMREKTAESKGITPLARVEGCSSFAHAPEWFTTAPVTAVERLLEQLGWSASDVDLYEVNEAFAVVAMAAIRDLGLSHDIVNVNGGALRARTSDRRIGRAHHRDAARRLGATGRREGHGYTLHRRR